MRYRIFADIFNGSKCMVFADNEQDGLVILAKYLNSPLDVVKEAYVEQDFGTIGKSDTVIPLGQ